MKYKLPISIAIITAIGLLMPKIAESKFHPSDRQFLDRLLISKQSNLVEFPEVGLAIQQPIGFKKATSFYGFEQSASNSSVVLTKIPGPYSAIAQGFDKKKLAARGITLISKQPVKIDRQQGILLQITQRAYGEQFRKWVLVFGNEQSTQVITATFLDANSQKIGEPLKKVLLTVVPGSVSAMPTKSSLPFTVTAVEGLLPVSAVVGTGKIAAFTNNGKIPLANPSDPLFVVTVSLGDIPVDDRKAFATNRLSNYPQTEIAKITATNEVTIDNLPGWEIIADGRDSQSKSNLRLYQVMLFPKQGGYILMTGLVGDKQSELYLPKFKAMALTYRNAAK